jgi:hypothetical protein
MVILDGPFYPYFYCARFCCFPLVESSSPRLFEKGHPRQLVVSPILFEPLLALIFCFYTFRIQVMFETCLNATLIAHVRIGS